LRYIFGECENFENWEGCEVAFFPHEVFLWVVLLCCMSGWLLISGCSCCSSWKL